MSNAFFYNLNLLTEMGWWAIHLSPPMREKWMNAAIEKNTRRECFPERLWTYIKSMEKIPAKPQVLDVGSGPLSPLAWGAEEEKIDLVATDPLANFYYWLLKAYGIRFPVRPTRCSAENLRKNFQQESFDIVYSRNALDHVKNAGHCFENIRDVLKKNGLFYFEGFTREGTKQKWRGLHAHDFFISDGNLFWENQKGERKNFSQIYGLTLSYQNQQQYGVGDWFIVEFKKSGC